MRKFFLPVLLLASAPLASCATFGPVAGTVQLEVDKATLTAITSFVELKRVALAGIKSGAITGAAKAKVIDLANKGQVIEDRLYATRSAVDVKALTDIVSNLSSLTGSK